MITANLDTLIVLRPNTRRDDLVRIAQRTNNPNVLAYIARHGRADTDVFAAVFAREDIINDATRIAVAGNDNADEASLKTLVDLDNANLDVLIIQRPNMTNGNLSAIAMRTNNVAVLADIARHAHADADVFAAVLNNQNINMDICATVAGNDNADFLSLRALVGLTDANTNAVLDPLIVQRPNTRGDDLITIAGRTNNSNVLADIWDHPVRVAENPSGPVTNAVLDATISLGRQNLDNWVAQIPQATAAQLSTIAARRDPEILKHIWDHPVRVAENPPGPVTKAVLEATARNRPTPIEAPPHLRPSPIEAPPHLRPLLHGYPHDGRGVTPLLPPRGPHGSRKRRGSR